MGTLQTETLKNVYYNVRVGGGSTPPETATPEDVLMWLSLTMLRIDAVVETENEVWIIEVRPDAGRSAFGAVMIYLQLWNANPPIKKPAIAVIVTDKVTPQLRSLFELNKIKIFVV